MTEWYSPAEKLPHVPLVQDNITVYTAKLESDGKYFYWKTSLLTFNPGYHGKSLFHSIDCYDDCEEPDFWCYLPDPPRELIHKFMEMKNE